MSTFTNTAREVEMPNGDVVVIHKAPTGGANTTSNIKKFKYDDNGHVTESTAADAEDLNLSSYSTPTTGTTAIGASDDVQTAIGKLDHQSQIDQTNILYVANKIGKNLLSRSTLTRAMAPWLPIEPIKAGTYVVSANIDTAATNWAVSFRDENDNSVCNCTGVGYNTLKNGVSATFTGTATQIKFWYTNGATDVDAENAMVCTPEAWSISHDFEPYALPNYDLTRLEAEDRAALAEEIDAGAKNKATISSGSTTAPSRWYEIPVTGLTVGKTYIVYFGSITSTDTDDTRCQAIFMNGATECSEWLHFSRGSDKSLSVKITSNPAILRVYAADSYAASENDTLTFSNLMICTKAAFGVSSKFVPYRPNYDLVGSAVSALNSTVFNSVISVNIGSSIAFTDITGGYIRIGNLVVVNVRCIAATNIPVNTAMLAGLPRPLLTQSATAACVTNNLNYFISLLGTGNDARISNGSTGAIESGTTLILSCIYIAG